MSIARVAFRGLLPLLILALAAGAVLLLIVTRPESTPEPGDERQWPVDVVTVERGSHAPRLQLQGFLESPRSAALRSAVEADVVDVAVREGDRLSTGDVLVRLDDTDLELTLRERRADVADLEAQLAVEQERIAADRRDLQSEERLLEIAQREMERIDNLANDAFSSQSDVDRVRRTLEQQVLAVNARRLAVETADGRERQLRARLERARALVARAERDLSRTRITAPFSGRVAAVEVSVGDRVGPGEMLVSVYDTDALEIRASVLSDAVPALRLALSGDGLRGEAHVDASSIPIRLSRLAGRSEPGQGGVDALFSVPPDDDLLLGRFAVVELELPPEPGSFLLPFEALYQTDRVYRVIDGRMQAVAVQRLGEAPLPDGRRGIVVRGADLADGDQVIVTQLPQALDGLSVRIVEGENGQ